MKSKIITSIKKLISILLCAILISSALPNTPLNGMVFALGGKNNPISPTEITFTKKSKEDKILEVKSEIKNYTITKIVNTTKGNQTLQKIKDYEVNFNKITLKNEYLENLSKGICTLKIYLCNSDTKEKYQTTIQCYIATIHNLNPPQSELDKIFEPHRGSHSDPAIYDPIKIRLDCGDNLQDEITYSSSNPEVATIDPKTGERKIKKAGKFKVTAVRKFKRPKDKEYKKLTFESSWITIPTAEEFINGGSSNKNNSNPSPIKLKKGNPIEYSKINNSNLPDILPENKNKNDVEPLNGTPTFPNINTSKNIPTFSLDGNNNYKNIPTKKNIPKTAPRKMIAKPITDENDNNMIKRESLLRNIHGNRKMQEEKNNNDILLTKLHKWNQKTEGIKQKATKNRIAKWLENKYKVSNTRGKWNEFADRLKSDDKSKNIKEFVDGIKKSVALKNIENVLSRKNNKEVFNALKQNNNKLRRADLLTNIVGKLDNNNHDILSSNLHKWTNNVKKLELDENARKIQHAYRNFRKKENQANALAILHEVLSRHGKQRVLNTLKENDKKNNNNIFLNQDTNTIFEIPKKIFQIDPNKIEFSLAGNAIISDPDSISIKGLNQPKPLTDTTTNNLKSSYNNESNETNKITSRSTKPVMKNTQIKSKIPVTIENVKIKNKYFDGTNHAEFDGTPTINGVIDGDDVKLVNGTPTFQSINIGNNIPINFTEFSLEGKDAYKYYIKQHPNNIYANIISRSNYKINELKLSNFPKPLKNKLNSINLPNNFQLNIKDNLNSADNSTQSDSNEPSADDPDEIFEAEDSATGIQVYAPKGVFPKSSKLVVKEMQQNTDEYDNAYKNLGENIKRKIEYIKLYEVCVVDHNNEIIQPNISKGLIKVKIPTPNDHNLTNLQINRIKQDANNNFNETIVNINNKNYCEFQTNHFSPYTIIDEKIMNDMSQSIFLYILLFFVLISISLTIIILTKRKTIKIKTY